MDNTTLELEELRTERAVLEALSPWGTTQDLFWSNSKGLDPNLISEEIEDKLLDYIDSSGDVATAIWFFSAKDVSEDAIAERSELFRHSRRPFYPTVPPKGIELIGHPLVSREVRVAALNADADNAEYLSSKEIQNFWFELSPFVAAQLIRSGKVKVTDELKTAVLRELVETDSEELTRGVIASAIGFDALLPSVTSTEQLFALIEELWELDLPQLEGALASEYSNSEIFFEILKLTGASLLIPVLELAATKAFQEETRAQAEEFLQLQGSPLDETPDPKLAVRARNARRRLKGDDESFGAMLEAEVSYRIYRGPYERISKIVVLGAPVSAGAGELQYELSKSIKEATDLRLRELAVERTVELSLAESQN